MQINLSGIKIPKISLNRKAENNYHLKEQEPDTFVSSRPSVEDAVKEFSEINNGRYGKFKPFVKEFEKMYQKNEIDLETVKTFSDTNLDLKSMSNVYKVYKSSLKEGIDMKKDAYENIHKQVKDIESYDRDVTIQPSRFNSSKELVVKDTVADISYTFSNNGEKIAKSYSETKELREDKTAKVVVTTEDYKANSVNEKYQDAKIDATGRIYDFETYKEVIDYKDENGNTKYQRISTLSEDVPGAMNIQNVYPDGTVEDLAKYSKDEKTGIITVKKDFTSPDGTRTQYLYEDDEHGNRIIDNKITNADGKVIYQNTQTFEVISDNKFITSNDGRKYEITADEKSIHIKELGLEKETSIEFKKKIDKFNRDEMVKLLKKVPGHLLFESAEDVKKYNGLKPDEALCAYSMPTKKSITSADNLFIFLHELGHIKDSETLKSKNGHVRHNDEMQYSGNEKIQKVYMKELSAFVEKYPHEQRENAGYFLENDGHYAGKWGALGEVVAETNAIGTAIIDEDSQCVSLRGEYLQENFPETIAEIKNAMRWKDDLDAIEFYGT